MAYWKNVSGKGHKLLDNYSGTPLEVSRGEFYEFEPGIVLDIILDEKHSIFQNKELTRLDPYRSRADVSGKKPNENDTDYSWIGRILVRLIESQKKIEKDKLVWAYPLEIGITEYPLINEIVAVTNYLGQYYYTRKINYRNFVNSSENFGLELSIGGFIDENSSGKNTSKQKGNCELLDNKTEYQGPKSTSRVDGGYGFEGVPGRYFWINERIRAIKKYEGDLTIESRFGQSIRFSAYDNIRSNDISEENLKDYHRSVNNPYTGVPTGGGNPMIIIRNRQRPILKSGEEYRIHKKVTPAIGTLMEKNSCGFIEEDINNDGSTIAITSGKTETKWVTTCYKSMWNLPTPFPNAGDQIIINTDRLILSSRLGESFLFSKKRYSVVTDSQCTIDAHDQIVLTTNNKVSINSPAIYLGEYDVTDEPALLGQTTVNWLYEMCNWLLSHTHWYKHSHPDAGPESPSQTQLSVQQQALITLRDKLHSLMSRRVFLTGGGLASGKNGEKIEEGVDPLKINVKSGTGVPGGFKGKNYRPS